MNESHGLTKPVIEILLDTPENIPTKVVVIFTTTNEGNGLFEEQVDVGPFASRCVDIHLTSRGLCEPFAQRIKALTIQLLLEELADITLKQKTSPHTD